MDITLSIIDLIKDQHRIYIGGLSKLEKGNLHCDRILNFDFVKDVLER